MQKMVCPPVVQGKAENARVYVEHKCLVRKMLVHVQVMESCLERNPNDKPHRTTSPCGLGVLFAESVVIDALDDEIGCLICSFRVRRHAANNAGQEFGNVSRAGRVLRVPLSGILFGLGRLHRVLCIIRNELSKGLAGIEIDWRGETPDRGIDDTKLPFRICDCVCRW